MNFSRLSEKAAAHLADIGRRCVGVLPRDQREWAFNTASLKTGSMLPLVDEVERWKGSGSYIYYFECLSSADAARSLESFSTAKVRDAGSRCYARPNAPNGAFYVGGSKSIVTRLKQHLGYSASKGTYSLQLLHWAPRLSLDLVFACARYYPRPPQEVLQALEDTLWDSKRPMFGRRGAR